MKKIRLPSHVKPERYKLLIKPDLDGFTFEGQETIFIRLDKSVSSITLHAKELSIWDVEYHHPSLTLPLKGREPRYDKKAETATFVFYKKLPKGKGELSLKFKGILNDKMRGFYRSRYVHQNKEKHLATTQFEATDARRAFPCFDEPAQKAVFDVTIMVPQGMTAISNTVETSVKEHTGGYKAVQFAPSPKMSTYLLAFIVGDFEYIEAYAVHHHKADKSANYNPKGTLVRVFTTPGKKHQAKFALDCAVKTLEFYNKYFDIPYPLPILDLIAIPDFSHGAMENWGAVTYRESALLVDPEHSSASNKQWVALVIAHELAHQWFGNLVTMHWWTDLWLNEGFASYIEYLAVDHLFPKWDIWTQFAYNDLGVALKLDGLKSTHPIEVEVGHPDEIGEIFDEVSYSKGASVIRMLANYLGEKDFRDSLRHYLKSHAYKNTKTSDLWQAMEKVSRKPVTEMMRNWTQKAGYPVIKVIQKPKGLAFKQFRFFSSPISKQQTKDKTVWNIPVKILNIKNGVEKNLLLNKSDFNTLEYQSPNAVKINAGESGFYRVDYPAQMLNDFHAPIKSKKLSALDRLGLVRDAFALSESGDLPTVQALELCRHYENETDYTVWVEIISGLNAVENLLYGQECYEDYRKFAKSILAKIVDNLGWRQKKNEPHTRSLLRSLVLNAGGNFGIKPVVNNAVYLFSHWMGKNKPVNADLRGVVYNLAAANGNSRHHKFLVKKYLAENLHEEKNRIGRALGQFKDDRLIQKSLKFALSKNVRYQDTAGIFMSAWANPFARQAVWRFTKAHWRVILERYPASGHMLSRFIKPASYFTSKKMGDEIKMFFSPKKAPGAKRSVEQALEKIYSNHEWVKRDAEKISNWLEKNK